MIHIICAQVSDADTVFFVESVAAMLGRIGLSQYVSLLEHHDVDETNMHFLDKQALESFGIGNMHPHTKVPSMF